ncbi:hypothetical protein MRS44_008821 [Fusarium solani]|uniref:uncharacterized protein n=1 Tax=Fusarium solani TaxID=169388 RepID=UPI0032C3F114|nr:hypothetical protein MRS44_008821 [Fusarium solani]
MLTMAFYEANESDPLLSGHDRSDDADNRKAVRHSRIRELGLFVWALVATAAVIVIAVWTQHEQQTRHDHDVPSAKRNLVFMVSDGMGPAPLSLTRSYRQFVQGLPHDDVLTLDKHFWGSSRTRSSSSLVTDSAAGATAFSCGKKSYNGAIAVLPNHDPCGTVLEAAKRAGYHTGLVVTTKIEDATPACFNSHVRIREMEDEIALQQIGEGAWTNWRRERRASLPGTLCTLRHSLEIDRRNLNDIYPSLSEMATTALRALEKATEKSDKGFFIMIEGSRIDHAGHINDPAAQVHEVLEYDKTFKAVLDFIKQSKTETVLVATSDHETGGLATAIQEPGHLPVYNWYPKVLANATASAEWLAAKLHAHLASSSDSKKDLEKLKKYINEELIIRGLGISNASDKEITTIAEHPDSALVLFSALISLRAHVGWSTHGHTAVDVNIYSSGGPGHRRHPRQYVISEELKEKMDKSLLKGSDELDEESVLSSAEYHVLASI